MTQDEQNQDLSDAKILLLGTYFTADRCRHESADTTTLWIFDAFKRQVGTVKRLPGNPVSEYRWEVSRLFQGQPVSRRSEKTLEAAICNIKLYEPRH